MRIFRHIFGDSAGNRGLPCLAAALAGMLLSGAAFAQEMPIPAQSVASSRPITLERRSSFQMDAADASLVKSQRQAISDEALFFGYDLRSGTWSYDQVLCPAIPDYLVLHYRGRYRNGTTSLFTALVPRAVGRVMVVPVLYRNATPYGSAAAAERTISVFNRVVPAPTAQEAIQLDGNWLGLALSFAAVAGAEPTIPKTPAPNHDFVRAPLADAATARHYRVEDLQFSDLIGPNQYTIWNISLNDVGRVVKASESTTPIPYAPETPETAAETETTGPVAIPPAPPLVPASPATPAPAPNSAPAPVPAATMAAPQQPAPAPQPAAVAAPPSTVVASPQPAEAKPVPPGPAPHFKPVPQGPPLKEKVVPPSPQQP